MTKLYAYKGCDGCKKAMRWLKANDISFEEIAIRETPPSIDELKTMLGHQGGGLKKLFNISGQDYRKMGLKGTLPSMSEDDALKLLSENGNLVKRPFLLSESVGLVGFKEDIWRAALL